MSPQQTKVELIIYYPKLYTTNFAIFDIFPLSASHLNTTNVMYKFKCPIGEWFFNKISISICLTTLSLSRHLTLYLLGTCTIYQHHKIHAPPPNTEKF